MFLQEPTPTPYDWRFTIFNFPVRISPWFWVAGAIIGSEAAKIPIGLDASGQPKFASAMGVLLFLMAMLISIVVHELGHAFAFRRYGKDAYIVLYHFGGLAVPTSNRYGGYAAVETNPWNDIVISAAGPLLQIASAVVLGIIVRMFGYGAELPILGAIGGARSCIAKSKSSNLFVDVLRNQHFLGFDELSARVSTRWRSNQS